jgi:hypothetical protein
VHPSAACIHGVAGARHILEDALLSWQPVDNRIEVVASNVLLRLYQANKVHNPLYHLFKPVLEQGLPSKYPVLDLSVLGPGTLQRMHTSPALMVDTSDALPTTQLGLLENMAKHGCVANKKRSLYEVRNHVPISVH